MNEFYFFMGLGTFFCTKNMQEEREPLMPKQTQSSAGVLKLFETLER
jgi:hypothetical protein